MAERLKLLLAAPNWLGDLVMSTSLLDLFDAGARLGLPRPELHVSVRRRWRPLLEGDPRITALIDYDRGGRHGGVSGILRQARGWREAGPAGALLLPPSLRAGLVARLSGLTPRIGFRSDGRSPLLSHAITHPPRGAMHYTEELVPLYAAWVEAITGAPPPGDLPAPPPRMAGTERSTPPGLEDGPPVLAIGIGATYGDAKSWPVRRVVDLVEVLHARFAGRVVLLGDPAARDAAADVRRAARIPWREDLAGEAGGVDFVGRTSLLELRDLLAHARVFVGNDSGPMHLAAALGTPTVGIFGSSSPVWTRPRGSRATTVVAEGYSCRPCFRRRCNQIRFCLDDIPAERVLEAVLSLEDAES